MDKLGELIANAIEPEEIGICKKHRVYFTENCTVCRLRAAGGQDAPAEPVTQEGRMAKETIWGLIAEWRTKEIGLPSEAHWADSKRTCANALKPIAEELEKAIAEMRRSPRLRMGNESGMDAHDCADRIAAILGRKEET